MNGMETGRIDDRIAALGDDAARAKCPRGRFAKAIVEARGDPDVAEMLLAGIVDVGGVADEYRAAQVIVREYVAQAEHYRATMPDLVAIGDAITAARDRVRAAGRARNAASVAKKEVETLVAQQKNAALRRDFVGAVDVHRGLCSSVFCLDGHIVAVRNIARACYALTSRARWIVQGKDCSTYWESVPPLARHQPQRLARFVNVFVVGNVVNIYGPGATRDVDLDVLAASVANVLGLDVERTWLALNADEMIATIKIGSRP